MNRNFTNRIGAKIMEKRILTDEEVRALKTILVEGNEQIIALHFRSGYYGRGGSNTSPFTDETDYNRRLERFAGQPPYEVFGMQVRAIVNDVVYLTNATSGGVVSFGADGKFEADREVAYDTGERRLIKPVVQNA